MVAFYSIFRLFFVRVFHIEILSVSIVLHMKLRSDGHTGVQGYSGCATHIGDGHVCRI